MLAACGESTPDEFDHKAPEPFWPDDDDASHDDDGSNEDDDGNDDDTGSSDDDTILLPSARGFLCVDRDGDGYGDGCNAGPDCNDGDPWLWYRGSAYRDADYDGYPGTRVEACLGAELPEGWGYLSTDCDDADARIHPDMFEFPDDGVDNDCAQGDASTADLNAIYVDGAAGDDSAPGTADSPKKTIAAGIAAAEASGADAVIVAQGEYLENVVTDVSLSGGYRAGDWARDIEAFVSYIVPATTSATVEVSGAEGPITVHGFRIDGPDNPDESRAILVSSAFPVWIGRNSIFAKPSDISQGIYVAGTEVTIVENSVELADGEEISAIRVVCATGGPPESVVVANDINGSVGVGAGAIAGVDAECARRVIANHVSLGTADRDDVLGIRSVAPSGDVGFRWIASNEVELAGLNVEASGIVQATLGRTVGNKIYAEVDGESFVYGIVGTIGAIASRNRIELFADPGERSSFLGIFGWNLLAAVNNQIILGGDWTSDGISLMGFDLYGWGDGEAFGVILNNTVVTTGPSDSGSAIDVWTEFGVFPTFRTRAVLSVANNILLSPHDRLGVIEIDAVDISAWVQADNFVRGTAPCLINTGECVSQLDRLNECEWEGCRGAWGNLSVDPMWADAGNRDYHLLPSSPMIDAALPATPFSTLIEFGLRDPEWNAYPMDIDGEPRPIGEEMDIGADEYLP
ncbi:MAG: putative metal-binding motif-containing protein [Deltaproteobacteria bacterium]|nr:putative metal-binding motif-containing protein [Deltaproteobacteria bacterium]